MQRHAHRGSQVSEVRAASILRALELLLLQDPFGGFCASPRPSNTNLQPLRIALQAVAAGGGPDSDPATGRGDPDSIDPRGLVFELEDCKQIFPYG